MKTFRTYVLALTLMAVAGMFAACGNTANGETARYETSTAMTTDNQGVIDRNADDDSVMDDVEDNVESGVNNVKNGVSEGVEDIKEGINDMVDGTDNVDNTTTTRRK